MNCGIEVRFFGAAVSAATAFPAIAGWTGWVRRPEGLLALAMVFWSRFNVLTVQMGTRAVREKWQEWRDSNPRPSVLETDALPAELHS